MNERNEEKQIEKSFDVIIIKRLFEFTRPYLPLFLLSIVLLLAATSIELIQPYLIKVIIDDYILVGNKNGLLQLVAMFSGLFIFGFAINYGQIILLNYIGQKQIFNMRQSLFDHLQRMPLKFFDANPVGRLVTRVTNDMNNINEMYTSVLVTFIKDFLLIFGTVIVMFLMDVKLALISISTVPIVLLATYAFRLKAREAHRKVKVKLAKINAALSENIMGMKIIQIFNREEEIFDTFDSVNSEHLEASIDEVRIFAIFRPSMNVIYALTLSLIIWYGGSQALQQTMELGVLFAFIKYVEQFYRPIFDLSEKFNVLQAAMASAERIFLLFDEVNDIEEPASPVETNRLEGNIQFENVSFKYVDDWVLEDISFDIRKGETVALVGATGSGKTTITSLLSRFYDIQEGQIIIDGVNIKDYKKSDLRSNIGIVLQDVFLFAGDIKSNIKLNNDAISDQEVQAIAKYVNADHFIQKLPDKYDEPVQERGATLSAGQRQLLSFARALAFDPSILVLDEATSNIDTETEVLIQDAINKLIRDRTTIIVAHRLSTIEKADKIVVLHKGKIREIGTHQELLANRGLYYDLYLLQYQSNHSK